MSQDIEPRSANSSPTMSVDVDRTRFAYREFGPSAGVPVEFSVATEDHAVCQQGACVDLSPHPRADRCPMARRRRIRHVHADPAARTPWA